MIGTAGSPKRPKPKVIAQITAIDAMNAPAIGKAAWQRTVSHNSSGSTTAPGLNDSQEPVGWVTTYQLSKIRRASTPAPSITWPWDGCSRHTWPSAITIGATTTMPTPSDRNHVCQTSQNGAPV